MIRLKHKWLIFIWLAGIGLGAYLINGVNSAQWFGRPSFSPDGKYLLFSYKKGFSENIYLINRNGSELTKLTSLKGKNYHPAFSPDGERIVFAHSDTLKHGESSNLYLMNSDGSEQKVLTEGPEHDQAPVFFKDGNRIYFLRSTLFKSYSPFYGANWHDVDIYSINPDGTNLKRETKFAAYSLSLPDISPDGKQILMENTDSLFMFAIDNPKQVEPVHPDFESYLKMEGLKLAEKESEYFMSLSHPTFAPDGRSIIFVWTTGTTNDKGYFEYELYRMDEETDQVSQLTNLHKAVSYPSYSLDGKEIVFVFDPHWPVSSPNELWIMNQDGSNLKKLNISL